MMGGNNVDGTESVREQRERCWVREMTNMFLQTIKPSASPHHHHHYKYHPKKWALGYLCFAFISSIERAVYLLSLYSHYANKV